MREGRVYFPMKRLKKEEPNHPSNSEIVAFYFTQSTEDKNKWICKCKKERTQLEKTGFSNLINHVVSHHSNYLHEMKAANENSRLDKYYVVPSDQSKKLFCWLDWIVSEGYIF